MTHAAYVKACTYPGHLDESAVNDALGAYLRALGIQRKVRRLCQGWSLETEPALARMVDEVLRDALAALAARDARDALDARDARDARERFARGCVWYSGWWSWDLSYLASTHLGAVGTKAHIVRTWTEPIMCAFVAGAWQLVWTDDTLYWVAKPRLHFLAGTRQLHCEHGPAMECDIEDLYYWRGVNVPREWIEDRKTLTPQMALTWPNIEQRRAACEIVGWKAILDGLKARVIDADDSSIGTLVEVSLPDSGKERFLRVTCGTKREFALPVPPDMKTALQAQAWTWGLSEKEFNRPEVRT